MEKVFISIISNGFWTHNNDKFMRKEEHLAGDWGMTWPSRLWPGLVVRCVESRLSIFWCRRSIQKHIKNKLFFFILQSIQQLWSHENPLETKASGFGGALPRGGEHGLQGGILFFFPSDSNPIATQWLLYLLFPPMMVQSWCMTGILTQSKTCIDKLWDMALLHGSWFTIFERFSISGDRQPNFTFLMQGWTNWTKRGGFPFLQSLVAWINSNQSFEWYMFFFFFSRRITSSNSVRWDKNDLRFEDSLLLNNSLLNDISVCLRHWGYLKITWIILVPYFFPRIAIWWAWAACWIHIHG